MKAAFEPIIDCAAVDLTKYHLKTEHLEGHELYQQAEVLRKLKAEDKAVILCGGSPYLKAKSGDDENLYFIGIDSLSKDEEIYLDEIMGDIGGTREDFLPCHFLFCRFYLSDLYRIKSQYRRKDYCRDILSVSEGKDYAGHQFHSLIDLFQKIAIYKFNSDNINHQDNFWSLPVYIALQMRSLRSDIVTDALTDRIGNLSDHLNGDLENIYNALTSTHYTQIFLEIYRYFENIFALPWGITIKQFFNLSDSALPIALDCRRQLRWRAREEDSIRALFTMVGYNTLESLGVQDIAMFKDVTESDTIASEKAASIGRKIYKIRNILVHKEDFEDNMPLNPREVIDERLLSFCCDVAAEIYSRFQGDIYRSSAAA
jgi:hypothetical protein